MKDVQKEFEFIHGWDSIITRGGILVIDMPFDSMEVYEVEEEIQSILEEMSLKWNTHFCYDMYNEVIKIYVLN